MAKGIKTLTARIDDFKVVDSYWITDMAYPGLSQTSMVEFFLQK